MSPVCSLRILLLFAVQSVLLPHARSSLALDTVQNDLTSHSTRGPVDDLGCSCGREQLGLLKSSAQMVRRAGTDELRLQPEVNHCSCNRGKRMKILAEIGSTETESVRNREVLLEFKAALSGTTGDINQDVLVSWNSTGNSKVCFGWKGVVCNSAQQVVAIDLSDEGLNGTISPILGNLSYLQSLNLSHNQLSGDIPKALGNLTFLGSLDLSHNRLTGSIPSELGRDFPPSTTSEVEIDLSFNNIYGSIPLSLGEYGRLLRSLNLDNNSISGVLPLSLQNCSSLRRLSIANNHLTSAPSWLGQLSALTYLDMSNNELLGSIPASLTNCTALRILRFADNLLGGPIGIDFTRLTDLQSLALASNDFTGGIPQSLRNCTKLELLNLSCNRLAGVLPSFSEAMRASIRVLNLVDTDRAHGNGGRDSALGLAKQPRLQILDLSDNYLTGQLPDDMRALKGMKVVADKITAPSAPGTLGEEVIIGGFKGNNVSFEYVLLTLASIRLAGNHLSGPIPSSLGTLTGLVNLDLGTNFFSGPIPASLGALRVLESLDLASNDLSGPIPSSLAGLNFLVGIQLQGNNLSGLVPSGGQFQNLNDTAFEPGNAGLCGPRLTRKCGGGDLAVGSSTAVVDGGAGAVGDSVGDWISIAAVEIGLVVGFFPALAVLVFGETIRLLLFRLMRLPEGHPTKDTPLWARAPAPPSRVQYKTHGGS